MADWREEVGEDLSKPVPIRAYARYMGVSDTAVRKGIARGDIPEAAIDRTDPKRPKIIPAIANAHWKQNHNPSYAHNAPQLERKLQGAPQPPAGDTEPKLEAGGNATLQAAKRAKAVYDAKLAELEYRQKSGELVKKDDVYRGLFAFGQEIRARMQAIPDRVIDDVLACENRNKAHLLLYNAISDALDELSNIDNKKIVKDGA